MPYQRIVDSLVNGIPGAVGAALLDYEGEAVVTSGRLPAYDLKVIGAYEGIFLGQLRDLCQETGSGQPERFSLRFAASTMLNQPLKDGYYLVLIIDHRTPEGLAWHRLESSRELLLHEL